MLVAPSAFAQTELSRDLPIVTRGGTRVLSIVSALAALVGLAARLFAG